MAKLPKWLDRPLPEEWLRDHELMRMLEGEAGRGVSTCLLDRAYWLDNPSIEPWVLVLEAVDKRGDKGPLLRLLRAAAKSKTPPPPDALSFLADLLDRHQLKKKRGAQATPAYDRTVTDMVLEAASKNVGELVKSGKSVSEALEQVSDSRGIPPKVLKRALDGTHSSLNRMTKRRP